MSKSLTYIIDALPALLQGATVTLMLTAFSASIGLVLGTLFAIARLSAFRPLRITARAYVDFMRGTPLLVQIFMIYFGIPALSNNLGIDFRFNQFWAAVAALSLNAAAYLAEVIRAGIQSMDQGQWEAAEAMGMGQLQTMQYIIFPQAFRRMIPPLGNEFITLLKDTSLVAVIGYQEMFRNGQLIVANTYRAFEIYFAVAVLYLVLTLASAQVFVWLEHRLDPALQSKRRQQASVSS